MSLKNLFVRNIPDSDIYKERLHKEMSWLEGTKAEIYIKTVAKICQNLHDIPYIIRGSAGSSLVIYLLGISDIDPVAFNISPERFFHPKRKSLPDIDLDFPDNLRDSVFKRIYDLFPGRVARISNHVQNSEKGAIRQAMRDMGYNKHIPEDFIISDLLPGKENDIIERASEYQNMIRSVALHVGGIVIFDVEVPEELKSTQPNQIHLDAEETESAGFQKIDILSNISLTQLLACSDRHPQDYPASDKKTSELLSSGFSFGITQAESPAFQKLLRAIKPQHRDDLILSLALIRPASAWRAHRDQFLNDFRTKRSTDLLVYEDDAISAISRLTGLPGPDADVLRRAFISRDAEATREIRSQLEKTDTGRSLISDIEAFKTFSMCKAHSISYGFVSWALAYQKAHDPIGFWHSALNHAKSMWRYWVHVEEAKRSGINIFCGKRPFKRDANILYTENTSGHLFTLSHSYQLKKYGYWENSGFYPGCGRSDDEEKVSFTGLIGTHRSLKSDNGKAVTFATIGTSPGHFLDVVIDGAIDLKNRHIIEGTGILYTKNGSESAKLMNYKTISI
jgi:DNA polymerase-3 subunit alpha